MNPLLRSYVVQLRFVCATERVTGERIESPVPKLGSMKECRRDPHGGADQTRLGLDPRRNLSSHQEWRPDPVSPGSRAFGKRIKYEKVVPGIGPVDPDEIVKGYEVSKGHYVLLDPEEIEAVKLESRKTLDLVQFVDEDDIEAMYFEKPYMSSRPTISPRSLCRPSRCAQGREEDRSRPDGDARPGICGRDQALGPRHPDGDAPLRRRGP
jgi:hypothetical protein